MEGGGEGGGRMCFNEKRLLHDPSTGQFPARKGQQKQVGSVPKQAQDQAKCCILCEVCPTKAAVFALQLEKWGAESRS